ncbi:unnamed protein product [Phyllotreta striolata]|uniref:Uncharacterized protein n=1 Tax=Phyllotreta striolata TaxID=444603 RepID=A0A9N9XQJ7_PHYSR|nr:unnamed protein product [Phyllotreta striolata]
MFKVAALCLFSFICAVQGKALQGQYDNSYTLCPEPDNPGILVATVHSSNPQSFITDIRIPRTSVFDNPISCIKVIDNKDNSFTDAGPIEGGLNQNFIKFRIYFLNGWLDNLPLSVGFDYTFKIYTKPPK